MTDREKAARAIGYLEGFSCIIWANVGEKLADESVMAYDEAVETLRKAIFSDRNFTVDIVAPTPREVGDGE